MIIKIINNCKRVWNLRKKKLYPDDFLMNIASNSSVERRVVNGRNAMVKHP